MNTKISALFLMMLLALGVTGIGAAYWNHSLEVTGTFTTGTFGVDWSLHCYGHNGWKWLYYDEVEEEDVYEEIATFDAAIDNSVDPKTLTMTLGNGFSCLYWWIYFDLHCIGSVPADLENFEFHAYLEDPSGSTPVELTGVPDWLSMEIYVLWPDDTAPPVHPPVPEYDEEPVGLYSWASDYLSGPYTICELLELLEDYQLHQSDHIWFFIMWHLYEDDTVTPIISPPQDSTLSFTIDFDAVQFNYD